MVMAELSSKKPSDLDPRRAKPVPPFLREKFVTVSSADPKTGTSVEFCVDPPSEDEHTTPTNKDLTATNTEPSTLTPLGSILVPPPSSLPSEVQLTNALEGDRSAEKSTDSTVEIPRVFPLSMLQCTSKTFPAQVDKTVSQYFKRRMARIEFTTTGGLSGTDYRTPIVSKTEYVGMCPYQRSCPATLEYSTNFARFSHNSQREKKRKANRILDQYTILRGKHHEPRQGTRGRQARLRAEEEDAGE